jgi:hypothetical protein
MEEPFDFIGKLRDLVDEAFEGEHHSPAEVIGMLHLQAHAVGVFALELDEEED